MDGIECGLSLFGFGATWSGRVEEPFGPSPEILRPRHFGALVRKARRMGLSKEDGEDVAQEALLRLHLYERASSVSSQEGFLRRTLHNLVIDWFRRHPPDRRRHISMEEYEHVLVSSSAGPERIAMAEDALAELGRRVGSAVPGAEKILMAYHAGCSVAEIAKGLPISAITVKRRLARARALASKSKG
jgi:RNA polymerase sigma factor (sigma-70 family)